MPYPESPFLEAFESKLITNLFEEKFTNTISNEELEKVLKWLCSFPKISSFRVNTSKCKPEDVLNLISGYCEERLDKLPKVYIFPLIPNVVIIHSDDSRSSFEHHDNEIIIDVDCASAVLRGAHIYAPGVMGMLSGSKINSKVSIYADIGKKCKKGLQKRFEGEKLFIGNGIIQMQRHQLFAENALPPSGVAIQVRETISGCPPVGDDFLPSGWALLQNLPSVLCVLGLNPEPNETVIDMCASPGNKTTHIAELMQNTGVLVAIDKTSKKVAQLESRCKEFGAKVHAFEADSRKIVASDFPTSRLITDGPPFLSESFDRVLLDAPCSVLGKRPQIANRLSYSEIKSYVPLQRKLFESIG